jgi:hypothetical protein
MRMKIDGRELTEKRIKTEGFAPFHRGHTNVE